MTMTSSGRLPASSICTTCTDDRHLWRPVVSAVGQCHCSGMTVGPESPVSRHDAIAPDTTPAAAQVSAVEKAIRARALDAIEQEQSRPPESPRRRVLIIVMTVVMLCGVVYALNWVVTGMHRIMDIWYPGSISHRNQADPPLPGTEGSAQPFAISVVPADEDADSASSSSSQ